MDKILYAFLTANWGLIVSVVSGIVYSVTHRSAAFAFAKRKASAYMFAAEKHAEQLVLTTGASRLAWVVDLTYNVLPAAVRVFVSKPALTLVVQALFDDAMKLAASHGVVVDTILAPVVAPVVVPAAPAVPVQDGMPPAPPAPIGSDIPV